MCQGLAAIPADVSLPQKFRQGREALTRAQDVGQSLQGANTSIIVYVISTSLCRNPSTVQ